MMYHAAAISYYTIVALVPLLTLLLFVTTALDEEVVATTITDFTGTYLLPEGEEVVLERLVRMARASHHTVIGLGVAVWGTYRTYTGLRRSFAALYEPAPRGVVDHVRGGVLTLLTVGVAVAAAAGVTGVVGLVSHPGSILGPLVLVVTLVIVFLPIYYLLPGVDLSPRDVLPGTVVAAVGWTGLSTGFAVYIAVTGGSASGVVGAFLLLLTWFYLAGVLLLFGGVVNAVLLGYA